MNALLVTASCQLKRTGNGHPLTYQAMVKLQAKICIRLCFHTLSPCSKVLRSQGQSSSEVLLKAQRATPLPLSLLSSVLITRYSVLVPHPSVLLCSQSSSLSPHYLSLSILPPPKSLRIQPHPFLHHQVQPRILCR